jgi:hypothetical protein
MERREAGMYAQIHCSLHEDISNNPLDLINLMCLARDATTPLIPLWLLAILAKAWNVTTWIATLCLWVL